MLTNPNVASNKKVILSEKKLTCSLSEFKSALNDDRRICRSSFNRTSAVLVKNTANRANVIRLSLTFEFKSPNAPISCIKPK